MDEKGIDWIMKKTPITIFGTELHIEVIGDETSPEDADTGLQGPESLQQAGPISNGSIETGLDRHGEIASDSSQTKGDKKSSKDAGTGLQGPESLQQTGTISSGRFEIGLDRHDEKASDISQTKEDRKSTEDAGTRLQGQESLQQTGTISSGSIETALDRHDEIAFDSSQTKASAVIEGKILYQILHRLGLEDKFPSKISMRDIVAVDPNESIQQESRNILFTDVPWLVLKRLMCAHSESRDITVSEEESIESSLNLDDYLSFFAEDTEDNQNISPLDIFTVIFQCCDPVMKQFFVQKLHLCKLAVPFIYRCWDTRDKQTPILSLWPLRSLSIENKQTTANKTDLQGKECDILELQTKVLAFGRLGRPRYSKSKLMNGLLLGQDCKTFFNIDCPSGMTPRQLTNGQIEIFWLPTIDERKDRFQDTMTFLNMRGDLAKDFDDNIFCFIPHFIDSIVIIVDLETVLKQGKMVENVLLKFSSIILILANPIKRDSLKHVQTFHSVVNSKKPDIKLRIMSTHKGSVEQNVVDMLSSITISIADQLKENKMMSFEERLSKSATIKTDEDNEMCQKGKQEASKLIEQMKAESKPNRWKQCLTPVHSNFSKELGKLLKERERQKEFREGVNIEEKIKIVRQKQVSSITKPVKHFLDILVKFTASPSELKFCLCWLHFYIEREKRKILPRLMHRSRIAWEQLKKMKSAEKQNENEIKKQETVITDIEENIDEASFTVQHFFREIAHINEAILELKENSSKFGLPKFNQMAFIVGNLVADGHPFELIDGESFFMPFKWIEMVLKRVDVCIRSSRVMTLSVLGLQSSGKSTLLNTMFGSQFSSRTGRCTRGIHIQLFRLKFERIGKISPAFDYILIVDTEGLRSPELSHIQHEHDNELATIITGVGDVTMLNIMGENTSEIKDILQVIVHAFLRLKMTNEKLDIKKSCAFIHQNVTDTSASENMISGLSKLMQTLDEMTRESARSEGILDINTFNQVIEFDINSQVWYLKNLWQGNPPMARVNTEYSERVVDIKCKILKKALTMKNKSYKTLNDIGEQAYNLWKGVLNEDFVFSFRNSLEIKAYMEMERCVQAELWRLESLTRDKLIQISQNSFANCDQKENIQKVADKLISDLHELLLNEKIKTEDNIMAYFEGNKYKDIIIQWKNSQQTRVHVLFDKLQHIIKEHVEKNQVKRSLEILTVSSQKKHEEELRKRSMEVANAHKGQTLSSERIDELFEQIWTEFLKKVDTSSSGEEKHRKKMKDIFQTCLENIFKEHHSLLRKSLTDSNSLTPLPDVKILADSFCKTGIKDNDISFTMFQRGKKLVGLSDTMKYVGDKVNLIFESVDEKVRQLCQVNDEIAEMSVNKLIHELDSSIHEILTKDNKYNFAMTFYVKLYVHVSRHVHPIFENHNEKYFKTQGTAILLEEYRQQQKISFESHLRCRQFEDIVANLFVHVIESFAEEWTSQSLPNKVTDELLSFLPSVKNRVIIEICTDLLEKGNFQNFINYIIDPHMFASTWITEKANHFMDDSEFQIITKTSSSLLNELFRNVNKCVNEVKSKHQGNYELSIDTWIESFQSSMKSYYCIPSENFRNVREERSSCIQNVEYLTTTISEHLQNSLKKLAVKFSSLRSNTIQWADFNPISRVMKKIWGCKEKCPFCGEPCSKGQAHDDSSHYSIQHRPSCCEGVYQSSTSKACLESCEFVIQSDAIHTCSVFHNKCDVKKKGCGKTHKYREYKIYFPNWDIPPTSNMHDCSKFWMWFVVTYEENLEKHYSYKIKDHIPPSWKNITKSEAKESLHKTYSA